MRSFYVATWVLWGASLTLHAHEPEPWTLGANLMDRLGDWSIEGAWDNRYFSEGRDQLDGDGIWHSNLEWSNGPLGAGMWYGKSTGRSPYEELQLSVAVTQQVGILDVYAGYTQLQFPVTHTHDDEFGAGVEWHDGPLGIDLALDAYDTLDAGGWFAEATATRKWQLSETLTLDVAAILGMNQGYVADGHDGANHAALQLGLSMPLGSSTLLRIHGTSSWAIDRDPNLPGDLALRNLAHVGVSLQRHF